MSLTWKEVLADFNRWKGIVAEQAETELHVSLARIGFEIDMVRRLLDPEGKEAEMDLFDLVAARMNELHRLRSAAERREHKKKKRLSASEIFDLHERDGGL